MGRIILFFLGSALFLSGCKNSKQPEGYNSVNVIEYVNAYDKQNSKAHSFSLSTFRSFVLV